MLQVHCCIPFLVFKCFSFRLAGHSVLTGVTVVQVLRMVKGLLDQMPTVTSPAFRKELTVERADVMLINMLCMVTKGVEACNQLVQCSGEAWGRR